MRNDFRLAVRVLAKRPGFAALAIFTLAVGIGSATAVFSLVNGVLLTRSPYRDADRLVLIPSVQVDGQRVEHKQSTPAALWTNWQQQAKSFDGIAAYVWTFNFLVDTNGSESMEGMVVTPEYFSVVGVQPMLGRAFTPGDAVPGSSVILLGYDFWQRRFNGDQEILGRTVRISRMGTPSTVVGVMPPGIRFLPTPAASQEPSYNVDAQVDFWMPGAPDPKNPYAPVWDVVGRMKSDVPVEQAQIELTTLSGRLARDHPELANADPRVERLVTEANRQGRRILVPLFGASLLVLLIACGNTAALLIVRGLQRQHEYAVRCALGSGRSALFRQASAESVTLALAGGILGGGLAVATVHTFKAIGGAAIPRLDAVSTGWSVLASGVTFALLSALLAGLFPAFRASRLDPVDALKRTGPKSSIGRGERRLLRMVSMCQIALTLALLVGAGLMLRTMQKIANVTSGYSADHVLAMTVTAVQGNSLEFHRRALEQVGQVPGVQATAFVWGTPLSGNDWPGMVEIEGHPVSTPADRIAVPLRSVTPGYFTLLGLPMLDGRDFRSTDDRTAPPVAVVNRALADRYLGGAATAVGKRMWLRGRSQPSTEVVGVAGNARTAEVTEAPSPEVYLSFWQSTPFSKDLVVRAAGDPRGVIESVRRAVRSVDPTVAVEHVKTLGDIRSDSLASRVFTTRLLVGFAAIGTLLTVVGIYGVLALSVTARQREIAIRVAIGARYRDVRNLVAGEGLQMVAGGVVIGLAGALAGARMLSSLLFDVAPTDAVTLLAAALLFVGVALLAAWAPTRRATRVDPMEALRCE